MRIPREKLYRAFRSLDHFTDEQCELLMHRVRLGGWRVALIYAVPTTCIVLGVPMSIPLAARLHGRLQFEFGHDPWHGPLAYLLCIPLPFALARVRCPVCRHLLIAETPDGNRVMCRECGRETTLDELGLEPGDLPMTTDRGALVMEGRAASGSG